MICASTPLGTACVNLSRRSVVCFASLLTVPGLLSAAKTEPVTEAARRLYLFGYPLLQMARVRAASMGRGAVPNAFRHAARLADHRSRTVTAPNNDTLYSSAWLQLGDEPVELMMPQVHDRYFSLALLDMFTNNFLVTGSGMALEERAISLIGPKAPEQPGTVRAPTPWVWALGRTLVDGADDFERAQRVQEQYSVVRRPDLSGALPVAPPSSASVRATYEALVALVNENLTEPESLPGSGLWPPHMKSSLQPEAVDDQFWVDCSAGFAQADAEIAAASHGRVVQGWAYPQPNLGAFGTDVLYRASIARWGLGALPLSEALYVRAVGDGENDAYDGRHCYRLRLPPAVLAEATAFWSLSLYEMEADGALYFADTPSQRYSLGDRSPDLGRDPDGGVTLWLGSDPGESARSNWLPAPAAPFTVIFRAYRPGPGLLSGNVVLPPIEKMQ